MAKRVYRRVQAAIPLIDLGGLGPTMLGVHDANIA
jgi:hypothetical protein